MLCRKVKIHNNVYSYHEVVEIKSVKSRKTSIRIRSYKNNPNYGTTETAEQVIYIDLTDGLTFDEAEEIMEDSPEFQEYEDPEEALLQELAPTLSDDQASSVPYIYMEWDAYAHSYVAGDRVRYSDGFYKCIQSHTSQVDWYPPNAASLWSSLIDATVLPIGDYPLWQQPESTNPYMTGDIVTFGGQLWISVIDNNVWAPGVYGWDVVEESQDLEPENPQGDNSGDEPSPEPVETEIPEWTQPDSTNPYMMGDKVTFNGSVYESLIDNNIWSPTDYPQGWALVS